MSYEMRESAEPTALGASSQPRFVRDWQNAVSALGARAHVRSSRPEGLGGFISTRSLAGVSISEISSTEQFVERTSRLVELSASRHYILHVQTAGQGRVMQDGREALLDPGDMALYDLDRPVSLAFAQDFTCLSIRLPRERIGLPPHLIGQITGTRMENDGAAGVASSFFFQLGRQIDGMSGTTGARLVSNAVDLAETVFRSRLEITRDDRRWDRRGALFQQLLDYIDQNLADSDMSPAEIAAAHFISTRHLYGLFQEQGITVADWIRRRRLEQCRRDLSDPRMLNESIAAIAARSGIFSGSYFSQAFRKQFGESASDVRRRAFKELRP